MKIIVQRVKEASVVVDNETIGEIGQGILALIGIKDTDNEEIIEYMVNKLAKLRVFEDENEKMNESVTDIGGGILLVPNFTIYGDARKGTRPSYIEAARPEFAEDIFNKFVAKAKETGLKIATGKFKADMKVSLVNDGPVTLIVERD